MTTVPRHPVAPDFAQKQLDALAPQIGFYLDYIEKDAAALKNVLGRALELAQYAAVLDPAAAEADLRTAAQAATAIFSAAAGEGEIEAVVAKPVRFQATGPVSYANGGAWLFAVWLAIASHEDELVQRLCAIPEETLRASGAEHDAYLYPWVRTVRNFLTNQEIPPELFSTVMDGTDPDAAVRTPKRAMAQLVYPPVEMFYFLLRRDAEKFGASLVRALEQHRKFWAGDLADDPDGFIAFAPLAIAELAKSAGMPVEVESEYLLSGQK
ncbi:immunity 49 family protein [Amycolatopsis sp. 195334CR]|uniref:immunity 49 family protein n=1 Tax=Amycolatopsis sp. 195334CR TaxID=2814588 RepID=UPI001A8D6E01|nr:immunity 49 family protein [Amycolatopsis sp. 195334CR]MBN6038311.1 immunity 49 family protein [Amycolatopsis sp. 195334CR]